MTLIRGQLVLFLTTALVGTAPVHAFDVQSEGVRPPTTITALETAVSFDAILRFLSTFRHDDVAEGLLVGLINLHGLSFLPIPEMRLQLSNAGASDALIKAIESARTVSVPAASPREGFLTVECQPVDCVVEIDGRQFGPTSGGALSHIRLPVGALTVRANKEDYEPDRSEKVVSVYADETATVHFQFTARRTVLEALGKQCFHAMLAALGREAKPASTMPVLRAVGTIYLHANREQPSAWSTVATIREPEMAVFTVARAGREYEISLHGGRLTWKRPPKDKEAKSLEDGLMTALNYHLVRLISRLGNPGFKLVGQMGASGELDLGMFRAESDSQSYVIKLDSNSRPAEVLLDSGGLDTSTRVLYSEYVVLGGIAYPRNTSVVLPGGRYGIEIRYHQIEELPPPPPPTVGKRLRVLLPGRTPKQ